MSFTSIPSKFGLANSGSAFSMVISEVLRDLNWKFVLVYVDDILVFSQNIQQHLSHLTLVFEKLKEAGLMLKPSKCRFAAQ